MNNWLNKNWILIAAIFIAVWNFVIYFFLWETFKDIPYTWPIIIFLEFTIFYIFVNSIILSPINELKREIASFLTWWKVNQKFAIKSANPSIQYIIWFFNKSLEILKNFKEELMSGKELKSEVQLASEIQKNTLVKNLPKIESIDIVANTKSATEVWWDSYDVIKQNDNYYIYLWDVTWHWVASGLVMMMVNALISGFSKMLVNSAAIIAHTNEILKPRIPSSILMTLLMVRWNETEKKLYMTWAWHEYLIIYKALEWKAHKIKSWWVALGMTKNITNIVKELQINIEKWDVVILYTDWITEARNSNKEDWMMYGIDRLIETIEKSITKTAQWIFNSITIELSRWMWYNHKQFDDITLLVMHFKWDEIIENDVNPIIPEENITEWRWK